MKFSRDDQESVNDETLYSILRHSLHPRATRRANVNQESLVLEKASTGSIPKIFVVCDQKDTAPVWGYILRQQGLMVILETSIERALDHGPAEGIDLIVLDLNGTPDNRAILYRKFREQSMAPLLLLLPTYHETEILDAYAAGVDDVAVKPVSPPVFLAKILAWARRSRSTATADRPNHDSAGGFRLDPIHRCLVRPDGHPVSLTNLEFRMLHLLMSRPGHVFDVEELVNSIWGGYGNGDQVPLKNVVYRLRRKIEADPGDPVLLKTWQHGYSFHGE